MYMKLAAVSAHMACAEGSVRVQHKYLLLSIAFSVTICGWYSGPLPKLSQAVSKCHMTAQHIRPAKAKSWCKCATTHHDCDSPSYSTIVHAMVVRTAQCCMLPAYHAMMIEGGACFLQIGCKNPQAGVVPTAQCMSGYAEPQTGQ